jgi:hypothetical protein
MYWTVSAAIAGPARAVMAAKAMAAINTRDRVIGYSISGRIRYRESRKNGDLKLGAE